MKVAIIFLDYKRHEFTKKTMSENLTNCGYDYVFIYINKLGVSAALNEGIRKAKEWNVDAIITMANDILMPFNWLYEMVRYLKVIHNTGMCGIHCVENEPKELISINNVEIEKTFVPFGNVIIPMDAINHVGGFNEEYDPYGMQDRDMAYRLNLAGYINYYIPGLKSEHIGHDVGNGTEYRAMKDESLAKAQAVWEKYDKIYNEPEYLINMKQFI